MHRVNTALPSILVQSFPLGDKSFLGELSDINQKFRASKRVNRERREKNGNVQRVLAILLRCFPAAVKAGRATNVCVQKTQSCGKHSPHFFFFSVRVFNLTASLYDRYSNEWRGRKNEKRNSTRALKRSRCTDFYKAMLRYKVRL